MTILVDGKELTGHEIRLEYDSEDGEWVRPEFLRAASRTMGDRRLYVGLLDLTETFRISAGLQDGGSIAWSRGRSLGLPGKPIPASSPTSSGGRASSSSGTSSS